MSVVAWDGETLAADRQGTYLGCRVRSNKLFRRGDISVAVTGEHVEGLVLVAWYFAGADPEEWPEFQRPDSFNTMLVAQGRRLVMFHHLPVPIPVRDRTFAIGSGSHFALGAMAAGADAREAVRIASRFDVYCGMGVKS
jgi:hypothetical protein